MKNECKIVRDLLPLYAENMVSEETAEFVKEHLANCPACAEELAALQKDDLKEATPENVSTAAPLKTLKKKLRRRTMGTISKTTVVVITIAVIVASLLAWRFWPHTVSSIFPVDVDLFNSISVEMDVYWPTFEPFGISDDRHNISVGEVLEILNESSYQNDFRNLIPLGEDKFIENNKSDSGNVRLVFVTRNPPKTGSLDEDNTVVVYFLNSKTIMVGAYGGFARYIYHLTSDSVYNKMREYISEKIQYNND